MGALESSHYNCIRAPRCDETRCDETFVGDCIDSMPRMVKCQCDGLKCRGCRAVPHPTMEDQELVRAARDGDQVALLEALEHGANLETRNPFSNINVRMKHSVEDGIRLGMTPLMYAAQEGHTDCLRLLLLARACVDAEDEDGMCALHFAATASSLDCAAALLWAGAYAAAVDRSGIGVLGHLPADVHADQSQRRRWKATLSHSDTQMADDLHAFSMVAEHVTKSLASSLPQDTVHSAGIEYPEPMDIDSLDYTGSVLESINFGGKELAAKCSARSSEGQIIPA